MVTILKPEAINEMRPSGSFKIYVATHDGVFHSDEVFSVALLRLFYNNIDIIRTRDGGILEKAVENPEAFVLDVGGQYDPAKRNFDHHQHGAPEGESTVSLLFRTLFPEYREAPQLSIFYDRLVKGINEWDQGNIDRFPDGHPLRLPQVISGFNRVGKPEQDSQFLKAVEFAWQVAANEMNTAAQITYANEIWERKEVLDDKTVLLNENCVFWRSIQGKRPRFRFIIQPGEKNWQVVSVDSHHHPLPQLPGDTKGLLFQHKDRFITVFNDVVPALAYAKKYLLTQ